MADIKYSFVSKIPRSKDLKFILENGTFISEKEIEIKVKIYPENDTNNSFSGELNYEIKTSGFYLFENGGDILSESFNNKRRLFQKSIRSRVIIRDEVGGIPDLPLIVFVAVIDNDGDIWPNKGKAGYYQWNPLLPLNLVAKGISNLKALK